MDQVKTRHCKVCGAEALETDKFCVSCGGSLVDDDQSSSVNPAHAGKRFCKGCGSAVLDTDKFCVGCGRALETSSNTSAAPRSMRPSYPVGSVGRYGAQSRGQYDGYGGTHGGMRYGVGMPPMRQLKGIWTSSYPSMVPSNVWSIVVVGVLMLLMYISFSSSVDDGMLMVISIAPSLPLFWYFYRKDLRNPEPVALLAKLFALGVLVALPVMIVELLLLVVFVIAVGEVGNNIAIIVLNAAWMAFVVAGFSEEYFKLLVVKKAGYNSIAFDERMDGVLYCVAVSLGFATIENILYVLGGGFMVGATRAVTAVPLHTLTALFMGVYVAKSKFAKDSEEHRMMLRKGLRIAILLHGSYNFFLMLLHGLHTAYPSSYPDINSGMPALIILGVIIAAIAVLFVKGNREMNKLVREDKSEEGRLEEAGVSVSMVLGATQVGPAEEPSDTSGWDNQHR